jgi:hypothetical protein
MYLAPAFLGVFLILMNLWDTFETIILPRRVARRLRLTTLFYIPGCASHTARV